MIKNEKLKKKIQEAITNLANLGVIPADEVQLNLDTIYNSVLNHVCSIVPMDSPRQIISCLRLIYDSEAKSLNKDGKDVFKTTLMNSVGALPLDNNGYVTNNVNCSLILNSSKQFLAPYSNILPNSIKINNTDINTIVVDNSFSTIDKIPTSITVIEGDKTQTFDNLQYNSALTLTSTNADFKCWIANVDGNIFTLGYTKTFDYFNVLVGNDIVIKESTSYLEENEPKNFVQTLQAYEDPYKNNGGIVFTADYGLIEGYTLKEHGVLMSSRNDLSNTTFILDAENIIRAKIPSGDTNMYQITKGRNNGSNQTWYGRAYAIVTNTETQEDTTLYGDDILSLTYTNNQANIVNLIDGNNKNIGSVDLDSGLFTFVNNVEDKSTLSYKYDNYNLEYQRTFAKFVKTYVEVFADIYQLDIDVAKILYDFKGINLKENIENILPQVLTQQIDQYVLHKYFQQAELQTVGEWNSSVNWEAKADMPIHLQLQDFGAFVNIKLSEYASNHFVTPNILICNPKAYNLISMCRGYRAIDSEDTDFATMPKLMGYYNNCKVVLVNEPIVADKPSLVITYRGTSDAQSTGVYTPYVPVTLRTVDGMEGGGMITTTNAYSIAGFTFTNPDLIEGIIIT